MPYCPSCRNEYEASVTRCADCEVDLVPALAPVEGNRREIVAVKIYAASGEIAARLERTLARSGYPVVRDPDGEDVEGRRVFPVAVPEEFAASAMQLLADGLRELQATELGSTLLFDWADAEERIVDPPLLKQGILALVKRGASVIPELSEIVLRGDDRARDQAASILTELGPSGAQALTDLALQAVVEERRDRLVSVAAALSKLKGYRPDEAFAPFLVDASSKARALACVVFSRTGSRVSIPILVPLLEDPEAAVREEAIEALYAITREDFGFEADAPDSERAPAVEKWRELARTVAR